MGGVLRNGEGAHRVPHVLNVSVEGVEGESLLAAVRPARVSASTYQNEHRLNVPSLPGSPSEPSDS